MEQGPSTFYQASNQAVGCAVILYKLDPTTQTHGEICIHGLMRKSTAAAFDDPAWHQRMPSKTALALEDSRAGSMMMKHNGLIACFVQPSQWLVLKFGRAG